MLCFLVFCHVPIWWHLIALIPDLCVPIYFNHLKYVHGCLTAGLVNLSNSDGVSYIYIYIYIYILIQ